MSIKQKLIYVCDHCEREIEGEPVKAEGYPLFGPGTISFNGKTFYLHDEHYCNTKCLFEAIVNTLR